MVGYVLVGWAATGDVASNSSDQRQLSSPAPALIQRRLDDRPGRGKAPPEVSSVAKNHHHHHIHADGRKNTPLKKYQKSFEVKNNHTVYRWKKTHRIPQLIYPISKHQISKIIITNQDQTKEQDQTKQTSRTQLHPQNTTNNDRHKRASRAPPPLWVRVLCACHEIFYLCVR